MFVELSTISVKRSRIDFVLFDIPKELTVHDLTGQDSTKGVKVLRQTLLFVKDRQLPLTLSEEHPEYENDKWRLKQELHHP